MTEKGVFTIKFLRLCPGQDEDIPLPMYMTRNCAGMDVCAAIKYDLILEPRKVELIPTGFAVEIPEGFEGQIRPRSGLAVNNSIGILNSPGTIDADYRGEIRIALINFGINPFILRRGDRIAQMVIAKIYRATLNITDKLTETDRGIGGFGHTGL